MTLHTSCPMGRMGKPPIFVYEGWVGRASSLMFDGKMGRAVIFMFDGWVEHLVSGSMGGRLFSCSMVGG